MAAKPLQWLFQLFDRMSGPAREISKAVKATDTALQGATKATQAVAAADRTAVQATQALTSATHAQAATEATLVSILKVLEAQQQKVTDGQKQGKEAAESWTTKLAHGIQIVQAAWGVVSGLGRAVWDLSAQLVHAAGQSERTAMSFKLLLGEAEGQDALDYLDRIARHSQFTRQQLQALTTPLVAKGYRAADISQLLPAALDVGAMFGGSEGAVARALEVFGKIRSTGKVEGEAFGALGLTVQEALGPLAKRLGTNLQGVQQQIGAGKIGADQLLQAMFQAITAKTGGPLGTAGLQGGATVDALLNKISGLPEAFMGRFNTAPAFQQFRGFLDNLNQLVDPAGPYGARIQAKLDQLMGGLFGALFGDFSGAEGAERLTRWLEQLLDGLDRVGQGFRDAMPYLQGFWQFLVFLGDVLVATWEVIKLLGEAIGWTAAQLVLGVEWLINLGDAIGDGVGRAYVAVVTWMDELLAWIVALPGRMLQAALDVGTAIWQGIRDGLTAGWGAVQEAVGGLADGVVSSLKGLLGISSPSRVMRDLFRWTGEGAALGIMDSAQAIDQAWAAAAGPDAMAPGIDYRPSPYSTSMGGVQLHLHVHVEATAADPQQLADVVVERVADRLPSMLEAAAADLAAEWGAG